MNKPRILVIDDNQDVAHALSVLFKINQMECEAVTSPELGLERVNRGDIDLVIQDMNFTEDTTSGEEGVTLFYQLRERAPDLPIVLITAWTHLETAIELVKGGAADYIGKPWDDDKLLVTVRNLLKLGDLQTKQRQQQTEKQRKQNELAEQFDLCGLLYQSQAMYELLRITTQVACSDISVMITGPNGAGKEKIAEIVQANSLVNQGPFIKVNVGALPKDLMEAELFGAEAGAYTGINKRRAGRFELADNGTLFLDEIGNLSLDGQAKLLRVLETGEFERIGGSDTLKVKVRIISATNADLKQAIIDGSFRQDLYYRLNVIELPLPALNQRKEDVLPLARLFLGEDKQLSTEAESRLKAHDWPGNIRELKNVMQRAALLSQEPLIALHDLGLPEIQLSNESQGSEVSPHTLTQQQIQQAIDQAGGVMADAARALGISRPALYRRIKKLAQEDKDESL